MNANAMAGGLRDWPVEAAEGFRALLAALAEPGRVQQVAGVAPPAPLSVAAGMVAVVLFDATTPVHLAGGHDCPALRDWLTFQTGAPLVPAEEAMFAIGTCPRPQPFGPTGRCSSWALTPS